MRLILPCEEFKPSYSSYVAECAAKDGDLVPWVLGWKSESGDFADLIKRLLSTSELENCEMGFVPHSTFWLMQGSEVVAVTNIRHCLNEKLLKCGGHVGYSVRPSRRRQGIGTKVLAYSLQQAREIGIERVLVCCDDDNDGSARVIEKNGGVFESSERHSSGSLVKRYWIENA